jgi:hypothetical protein
MYILGSILLACLIVLVLKLINTVDKTNSILDNIEGKVKSLDGLFETIDKTTSTISSIGDRLLDKVSSIFGKFGRKRKLKEEDDIYDEIFPDYNDVINNNYYENKYMKNNYINLRLKSLKLKKYFLNPLKKDEFAKHNNTDTEDEFGDINYYQNKKSRASINYYKTLLPKAEISRNILKNYYYKNPQLETEYDANKKVNMKKSLKFSEDSNFLGDGNANRLKGRKMKN